ncbi:hypothetical protein WCLP8_2140003 [uncultured Gammaproteobacteria bacterium]
MAQRDWGPEKPPFYEDVAALRVSAHFLIDRCPIRSSEHRDHPGLFGVSPMRHPPTGARRTRAPHTTLLLLLHPVPGSRTLRHRAHRGGTVRAPLPRHRRTF